MNAIVKLDGLRKNFGGLSAVKDVSFSVYKTETLGIIGPNGAGKTTLYNLISGLLPLDGGEIWIEETRITGLPAHAIVKRGIARTFQGTRIFRNLSLIENLKTARHCRCGRQGSSDQEKPLKAIVEFLGLSQVEKKAAGDLRLYDQVLLGIGMGLCTEPKVLLLDEPSAGLNFQEVKNIMGLIKELTKRDITVFLIEHNMKAVMSICDRIVVLNHGEKIAEGTPAEISTNKDVIRAYLGAKYAA